MQDVPEPVSRPDEVLVRVKACGICGSDIRYYLGENPWALHTLGRAQENPPNIILGHEFAGEVVDAGGDAAGQGWLGKRVVVSPYKTCGICSFCRDGQYHLCRSTTHYGHGAGWGKQEYYPGGMAELCSVWANKVYLLPDSLSWAEAAMLDITGVGIHALGLSGISPGSAVAILGVGPLGASLVQTARIWGAIQVFCSDRSQKRLDLAGETGADEAINVEKEDPVARVRQKTNDRGVDVVIDTVCSAGTQREAIKMLAPQGTLVNMAMNATETSFKLSELGGERAIRSSCNYFFHEFQMALDLAAAGKVRLGPLITDRFPLSEANSAFDLLLREGAMEAMKVVILP